MVHRIVLLSLMEANYIVGERIHKANVEEVRHIYILCNYLLLMQWMDDFYTGNLEDVLKPLLNQSLSTEYTIQVCWKDYIVDKLYIHINIISFVYLYIMKIAAGWEHSLFLSSSGLLIEISYELDIVVTYLLNRQVAYLHGVVDIKIVEEV